MRADPGDPADGSSFDCVRGTDPPRIAHRPPRGGRFTRSRVRTVLVLGRARAPPRPPARGRARAKEHASGASPLHTGERELPSLDVWSERLRVGSTQRDRPHVRTVRRRGLRRERGGGAWVREWVSRPPHHTKTPTPRGEGGAEGAPAPPRRT